MQKTGTYLFLILLTIVIGTIVSWKYCCNPVVASETNQIKNTEPTKPVAKPVVKNNANGFYVNDTEHNFQYKHADNINFKPSGFAIVPPVSEYVDTGIEKLKNHLTTNPNKTVDITGYYKKNEEYPGPYDNLGVARANSVKNYFVKAGVSSKQIDVHGQLRDTLFQKDALVKGPLSYVVKTVENNDQELLDLKNSIQKAPLILYFNTGESSISLSAEQRKKLTDISRYLDKVPTEFVQVTGHTDSKGNANSNVVLGQKRAEFAKDYLISNGITASKIKTDSKGPHQPIESNDTEAGRAKNRRTVITIN